MEETVGGHPSGPDFKVLEALKEAGNGQFKSGRFKEGLAKFEEAIALIEERLDVDNHQLLSLLIQHLNNKSLCLLKLNQFKEALQNA